ncbi:general transcription factor II-I repeat domain-containing protein 2-like, partial [Aphis craccivora]
AINETGLKVRATVSDQGKTNVTEINNLLKITNQKMVSAGEVNKYVGYLVNNIEVVHIYDPPHLFKYTSLGDNALGTVEMISLMNKLFDSVNGSSVYARDGKPLRCAVKNDSFHIQFWIEAINIFNKHSNTEHSISTLPVALQNPINVFNPIQDMTVGFVAASLCSDQYLRQKLILLCEISIDFSIFKCEEHILKNIIIDNVVILYLFIWCKNINRILHGIDRHVNLENKIKQNAFIYYNKHCKKRLNCAFP